ncbi:2974_t:CDS:1 [Paraglomus brasilianum]|uniref:2974_t:CDS:1 n=1 Tax=Paraglomus brasilianum TaxID=144538 RepID=A0A9N9C7X7_9GLOM|nr:2974_t:CDS:1 [Paraglomus brasilianum]
MLRSFTRLCTSLYPQQLPFNFRVCTCNINCVRSHATLVDQVSAPLRELTARRRRQKEWTYVEKNALATLVRKFGGDWIRIAAEFIDKTPEDCYKQWANNRASSNAKYRVGRRYYSSRNRWTMEEKQKLLALILKYGKKWVIISEEFPNRSPAACAALAVKDKLTMVVPPDPYTQPNQTKWTSSETKLLNQLIKKHGRDLNAIATKFPGRTFKGILNYVRRHIDRLPALWDTDSYSLREIDPPWTKEEEELLIEMVNLFNNADLVSGYFYLKSRQGVRLKIKQLWEDGRICVDGNFGDNFCDANVGNSNNRKNNKDAETSTTSVDEDEELHDFFNSAEFYEHLQDVSLQTDYITKNDPAAPFVNWERMETANLIRLYSQHGPDWKHFAKLLPGRTAFSCKIRCYSLMTRRAKTNNRWSVKEAYMIREIAKHIGYRWDVLSKYLQGRSYAEYASRWTSKRTGIRFYDKMRLLPEDETNRINTILNRYGPDWGAIAELTGRHPTLLKAYVEIHPDLFPASAALKEKQFFSRRYSRWSSWEIKRVNDALREHGRNWVQVASKVPDRSLSAVRMFVQCHRELFSNYPINYRPSRPRWSNDEVQKLCQYVTQYGRRWRAVAECLPLRTPDACKRKHFEINHTECLTAIMLSRRRKMDSASTNTM